MYIYQCDLMEWSGQGDGFYATIGYNLNGQFVNHPLTATAQASDIACLSQDVEVSRRQASRWHNQIYQLPIDEDPLQQLRSQCFGQRLQDIQTLGDIMPLGSTTQTIAFVGVFHILLHVGTVHCFNTYSCAGWYKWNHII